MFTAGTLGRSSLAKLGFGFHLHGLTPGQQRDILHPAPFADWTIPPSGEAPQCAVLPDLVQSSSQTHCSWQRGFVVQVFTEILPEMVEVHHPRNLQVFQSNEMTPAWVQGQLC